MMCQKWEIIPGLLPLNHIERSLKLHSGYKLLWVYLINKLNNCYCLGFELSVCGKYWCPWNNSVTEWNLFMNIYRDNLSATRKTTLTLLVHAWASIYWSNLLCVPSSTICWVQAINYWPYWIDCWFWTDTCISSRRAFANKNENQLWVSASSALGGNSCTGLISGTLWTDSGYFTYL